VLVWSNGVLTKITGPGTSEDFDVPAGVGAQRWAGAVDITIRRDPIVEVRNGQTLDVVRTTRIEIPYDVGRLIEQGDTLTYLYEEREWARAVDDITRVPLTGRVRVELEPA
jgi:hypothetical protein